MNNMQTSCAIKRKPNWLFRGLIGISIGIHAILCLHISGVYNSNMLQAIELTLQDISKPLTRDIPRPKQRPKTPEKPRKIEKLRITQRRIPKFRPIKLDSADSNLSDGLMVGIGIPDIPEGMNGDAYSLGELTDTADYTTPDSYFEMVILRIEAKKRYPEAAKSRNIEGRVTVGFTITLLGNVRDLKVVKPSRHQSLDNAALQAIQDSAPFPSPPRRHFEGDIPLELNIIFETT